MPQFLHSWPVLFASALAYHIGKLLTFQHDGHSLPRLNGSSLIPLLVLFTLASVGRFSVVSPEHPLYAILIAGLAELAIVYGLARLVRKPALFSGALLVFIGINLGATALGVLAPGAPIVRLLTEVWGGLSLGMLYVRLPKEPK